MSKRIFDFLVMILSLPVVLPVAGIVGLAILIADGRPVLYWSRRVGRNNQLFAMPKFRTMRRDTPAVATHLLADPDAALIPLGRLLRSTSLDELPQLFSVLQGHMTLVGPRPALFNQEDLMDLRTRHGVHRLVPGITGWAQVNGRDDLSIPQKVALEREYLNMRNFTLDLKIIYMTIVKVIIKEGVHH